MLRQAEDFDHLRQRMLSEQLLERGIRSQPVLDAMARVPREEFVAADLVQRAYEDEALRSDCGQTISQPYMVALMTELLELGGSERVLEIGTGTGYQTAVLALIAREVFTIEWHMRLLLDASERLEKLGFRNTHYRCGDGTLGWAGPSPFDAIMVTAGGPIVPEALTDQLATGGRMVAPVGPEQDQTLVRIIRTPQGLDQQEILRCRFVKLVGEQGWKA